MCYFAELATQADDTRQHCSVVENTASKARLLRFESCSAIDKLCSLRHITYLLFSYFLIFKRRKIIVTTSLLFRWLKGMMFVKLLENAWHSQYYVSHLINKVKCRDVHTNDLSSDLSILFTFFLPFS